MQSLRILALICIVASQAVAAETVLVAGATGRTGSALIKQLKAQNYDVVALARDPEAAAKEFGTDYVWIKADVRRASDVESAFAGRKIDYVVSAIGSLSWFGPNSPQFVDYIGTKNLVDAAKAAGVKRFIVISVGNVGPRSDQSVEPSFGYLPYWKTKGEDAVKSSGIDYVIIGPGGLTEEPSGTKGVRLTSRKDYKSGRIPIGDAAMVTIDALTNPDARNKAFGIVADEKTSPQEWKQALKAVGEEPLGLPLVAPDPKSNTVLEALDPPSAAIQRFMFTAFGTQIRGQEVAVPDSGGMFCTLSNASNTFINYFPKDASWKIQMLHDGDPSTMAGGLVTCHRLP